MNWVVTNRATTGHMSTMLSQSLVPRTTAIVVATKLLYVSLMTPFHTHCEYANDNLLLCLTLFELYLLPLMLRVHGS